MNKHNVEEKYWTPEKDIQVKGIVVDKLTDVGRYNSNLYKIQDGEIIYNVWGKYYLDELMEKVDVGDLVLIRYRGTKKTSNYLMMDFDLVFLEDKDDLNK